MPTYPIDTIAKLLDLSPRRVYQLASAGIIPRAERGRYELVPAVRGYIKYLKDRFAGADLAGGYGNEKQRILKARADLMDMEVRQATGELVQVEEVQRTWVSLTSLIRNRLLALPAKCAVPLAGRTAEEVYNLLETEVYAALKELAGTEVVEEPGS